MPGPRWFAILALCGLACGASGTAPRPRSSIGPLPDLAFALLDGGTWSSTEARGAVQVIDIWATWCPPCRKSFAVLDRLARQWPELRIVAISVDEEVDLVRDYRNQVTVSVPIALDPQNSLLEPPIGVTHLPTILLVDRDGSVRLRLVEPTEADYAELERAVAALAGP